MKLLTVIVGLSVISFAMAGKRRDFPLPEGVEEFLNGDMDTKELPDILEFINTASEYTKQMNPDDAPELLRTIRAKGFGKLAALYNILDKDPEAMAVVLTAIQTALAEQPEGIQALSIFTSLSNAVDSLKEKLP